MGTLRSVVFASAVVACGERGTVEQTSSHRPAVEVGSSAPRAPEAELVVGPPPTVRHLTVAELAAEAQADDERRQTLQDAGSWLGRLLAFNPPVIVIADAIASGTRLPGTSVTATPLTVTEVLRGTAPATITVVQSSPDSEVSVCGGFRGVLGARYLLFLSPSGAVAQAYDIVSDILAETQGWLREQAPNVFRFDRGPTLTRAQLLVSLASGGK